MSNQLKLGIFTIIGLFAIVISIFAAGTFSLGKTYNIYVKFDNIAGLTKKAKVKIAGVNVGVLREVSLEDSKAKLKLSIDSGIVLYKNASANIISMGVVGTKYIEIMPGDSSSSLLKNGDYISVGARASLEGALMNITNKISRALDNEKDGNMMENLADAIYSFKHLLENLASRDDGIAEIVKNFCKFSADIASVSADSKQDLRDAALSIKDVASKLDILITRAYDGNGMIATLINDEQFCKDLKETAASAKATVNSLKDTVDKSDRYKFNWDYVGRYSMKDKKFRSDVGISIMPSEDKFYYVGVSNFAERDSVKDNVSNLAVKDNSVKDNNVSNLAERGSVKDNDEKDDINKLEILLGLRSKKAEVYGGLIRGKMGIGFGYSFFQPICASYKALKVHLKTYDFRRENHRPRIDAGTKFGITNWLYAGIAVEDIAYKTAVTPYLKVEFNDKDLASIIGIIAAATAIKPK